MSRVSSNSDFVPELASLLRENADKIREGKSWLSLTTSSLSSLNEYFGELFDENGQQSSDTQSRIVANSHHVQFLLDVIQTTPSLKLIHGMATLQGTVSLAYFTSLKYLEIKRFPLHLLTGLQSLRTSLAVLICSRCVRSLEEVFSSCGGDQSSPQAWQELHSVNLSYNQLERLDDSLTLLPVIRALDLSHNNLTDLGEYLEYLTELTHLNLGSNRLEHMPSLAVRARAKLKELVLQNNNLEGLKGIEVLVNLQKLDLSNNCVIEQRNLRPLASLAKLKSLKLHGNPLSFGNNYRLNVACNLSLTAANNKVLIDSRPLSKRERAVVSKSNQPQFATQHALLEASINNADINFSSDHYFEDSYCSDHSTPLNNQGGRGSKSKKSKKYRHLRNVAIGDLSDTATPSPFEDTFDADVEDNQDIIQTIQQVESRRRILGSDWLIGSPEKIETANEKKDGAESNGQSNQMSRKNSREEENGVEKVPNGGVEEETTQRQRNESGLSEDSLARSLSASEEEDDEDIVSGPHLVIMQKQDGHSSTHIFVTIKGNYLEEKDFNGKVMDKLDLNSLQTVHAKEEEVYDDTENETLTQPRLSLTFSYLRKDRKSRDYIIEDEESYEELYKTLKPVAERASASQLGQGRLQCLKCSSEFYKIQAHRKVQTKYKPPLNGVDAHEDRGIQSVEEVSACPHCGSTMLLEVDEAPLKQRSTVSTPVGSFTPDPLATSSPWRPLGSGADGGEPDSTQDTDTPGGLTSTVIGQPQTPSLEGSSTLKLSEDVPAAEQTRDSSDVEAASYRVNLERQFQADDMEPYLKTVADSRIPQHLMEYRTTSALTQPTHDFHDKYRLVPPSPDPEILAAPEPPEFREDRVSNSSDIAILGPTSEASEGTEPGQGSEVGGGRPGTSVPGEDTGELFEGLEGASLSPQTCASIVEDVYRKSRARSTSLNNGSAAPEDDDLYLTPVGSVDTSGEFLAVGGRRSETPTGSRRGSCSSSLVSADLQPLGQASVMEYNLEDFTAVDHRLKLHLAMNVFRDAEEVACLIKTSVIQYMKPAEYQVLLIASNQKIYIMKITKEETVNPAEWLQKKYVYPLTSLGSVSLGLGQQTFRLEFDSADNAIFTFLPRDSYISNKFSTCLTESISRSLGRVSGLRVVGSSPESSSALYTHVVSAAGVPGGSDVAADKDQVIDTQVKLYLLLHMYVKNEGRKKAGERKLVARSVVMSSTDLWLAEETHHLWPLPKLRPPSSSKVKLPQFLLKGHEKISNITSLDLYEDRPCHVTIRFFNEDSGDESSWCLVTETQASLDVLLSFLRDPWEELFGIDLEMTVQAAFPLTESL